MPLLTEREPTVRYELFSEYGRDLTRLENPLIGPNSLPVPVTRLSDAFDPIKQLVREGFDISNVNILGGYISVKPGDSIQDAINLLDARGLGGMVFAETGTHFPSGDVDVPSEISIAGAGAGNTILDFGDSARGIRVIGTPSSVVQNILIKGMMIQNSNNAAGIDIDYVDFFRIEDVRITNCDQGGLRIQHSQNYFMQVVRSDNNTTFGFQFVGDATRKCQNFSLITCQADNNGTIGFRLDSTGANLVDFTFVNCNSESNTGDAYDITGGFFALDGSFLGCNAEANGGNGFDVDVSDITFVGCQSDSNTGDGFEISQIMNRLIGCSAAGNGTEYDINSSTVVIGSRIPIGASVVPSDEFSETDTVQTQSIGNLGGNTRTEKLTYRMKNGSGATVAIGDVVTFNAAADGDEFNTTMTSGDNLVFGMAMEGISNGNYGPILVSGYTKLLKVNGTTDIAIGDFLGTHTVAGIASKVTSGMAFAIALEAYTTDDSNGVIDALIISPRKIIGLSAVDTQIFTSSGTYTKPAGVTAVMVTCIGGGGGGGGAVNPGTNQYAGAGGGGASRTEKMLDADDIGSTEAITVGAAGTGGAVSTAGGSGGTSSFGTLLRAYGGGGGYGANGAPGTYSGGSGGGSAGAGVIGNASSTIGGIPATTAGASGISGQGGGGPVDAAGKSSEWGGGAGGGSPLARSGGSSVFGGAGGGSGARGGAGNDGGTGGSAGNYGSGGGGAGGTGTTGGDGTDGDAGAKDDTGDGAGGGGSNTAGIGGSGGIGGTPGGGGGGGAYGSSSAGSGGTGGRGEVRVYSW